MLIVPPQLLLYMALAPEEKVRIICWPTSTAPTCPTRRLTRHPTRLTDQVRRGRRPRRHPLRGGRRRLRDALLPRPRCLQLEPGARLPNPECPLVLVSPKALLITPPSCSLAVRGVRRPGLRPDAPALVADRRVLPHVAAAGVGQDQEAPGHLSRERRAHASIATQMLRHSNTPTLTPTSLPRRTS